MRLMLVLLVAFVLLAAPAQAGTYDVWSCAGPTWKPLPTTAWRAVADRGGVPEDWCATPFKGMQAGFSGTQVPDTSSLGWWFEAAPDTTIASYELYRSARSGSGPDGSNRAYGLYHDQPVWDPGGLLVEFCTVYIQGCAQVGEPESRINDPDNRVVRESVRLRRLILRMECRKLSAADCGATSSAGGLVIGRARVSLSDEAPPVLGVVTGTLMRPGAVLEGVQSVRVSASDKGGGVERYVVMVDGATAAEEKSVAARCRAPFVESAPCPTSSQRDFAFDTASVPNGSHAVQIAAVDAGGNRTVSSPAVRVHIANGGTPNGVGASRRARLTARFTAGRDGDRPTGATVGFRGARAVRGFLTDDQGTPIGGAQIDVVARVRRSGAKARLEGRVETSPKGHFRYRPPTGPSRRLRFEYRAFSLDPGSSTAAQVVLKVRAGIRLAVRPRRTTSRGTIDFRGRLLRGPGRGGVQVTLYAVGRRGRDRVPVEALVTDARGRFRFRYRFRRTFAPFTYHFQARTERQRNYPYEAGASRRATVHVVR